MIEIYASGILREADQNNSIFKAIIVDHLCG
jgi:hypothetical protein